MTARETENGHSSNGHNGNGNGNGDRPKVFGIVPAEEELSSIAPRLRRAARMDRELTDGAKVLFDHLTDDSFLMSVSPARGVVTKSKPKLADELNCSVRSITRYEHELSLRRFIWTRTFWRGGFELTNWYIRGMAKAQQEFWQDSDPSWGRSRSGQRRSIQRGPNGQFCPYGDPRSESTDLLGKSAVDGQPCPSTTDSPDRWPRTAVSLDKGQPCPLSTDSPDREQRTVLTVDQGQPCPWPTDTTDRSQRSAVAGFKESQDVKESLEGTSIKRSTGFDRAKKAFKRKKPTAENRFLDEVEETLDTWRAGEGESELSGSGAWWRLAFRARPNLMQRVLAEVRVMIKEGTIRESPGKAAADLYSRWGADSEKDLPHPMKGAA